MSPTAVEKTMKLDQEDYENIFLRVRGKLVIQLFALFAFLFTVLGITTWISAKAKIEEITESAVNNYVQSAAFKKTVVASYEEKLARLENQAVEVNKTIAEAQKNAVNLSQIPIVINEDGLTLFSQNGKQFRIEMGSTTSGAEVLFKAAYKSEPIILLSIDSNATDEITRHRLQTKGTEVLAAKSSTLGFEIPKSIYPISYRWVAIGN